MEGCPGYSTQQLAGIQGEYVVQAFSFQATDEAFADRAYYLRIVRLRRSNPRLQRLDIRFLATFKNSGPTLLSRSRMRHFGPLPHHAVVDSKWGFGSTGMIADLGQVGHLSGKN
jgi:hypothetical protein